MALDLSGWANNTIAENERTFRSDGQDLEPGEALRTCIERHIILYKKLETHGITTKRKCWMEGNENSSILQGTLCMNGIR